MDKRTNTIKTIGELLPSVSSFKNKADDTAANKAEVPQPKISVDHSPTEKLLTAPQPANEKQPRCRFDMFVRVKKDHHFKFPGGKKEFTIRGDKYEKEDTTKMLKFLLNTVKNHYKQYFLVELYDHSKPANKGEKLILKILNGVPKINLLTEYAYLLNDYHLPEYLSVEIKP